MAALCGRSTVRAIFVASKHGLRRPIFTTKVSLTPDEVTHTGQSWNEEDLRSLRFMDKTKETNTKWAIDLIANVPPIIVEKNVVACDGGANPALGHPKVFINLDSHDPVGCIYCGLRYQLKGH